MLEIIKKEQCCGCAACVQICPKKCIKMKEDSEGFLYPEVDHSSCVDCGRCESVCPVQNAKVCGDKVQKTYVAYANDEAMRLTSSSGGIFTLLAEQVLKNGGMVFGAAFDDSFMVHHIGVKSSGDLERLRGSKYLQSRIENTYIETKEALKAGKTILYTGTACQIAGLHHFLEKDYENLYTVDVLCHGVPSPKLWDKYLKEQSELNGGNLQQTSFRQKTFGWKDFSMELQFSNSKTYEKIFKEDSFMKLFLRNICLRPSCHDCKFKKLERLSDLSIGDCWGIQNYMPNMDDDKGTSVVLIHSEKGAKLFDAVADGMVFCEAETERALPPTADSRKSVPVHPNRSKFFKKLNKNSSVADLVALLTPSIWFKAKRKAKHFLRRK